MVSSVNTNICKKVCQRACGHNNHEVAFFSRHQLQVKNERIICLLSPNVRTLESCVGHGEGIALFHYRNYDLLQDSYHRAQKKHLFPTLSILWRSVQNLENQLQSRFRCYVETVLLDLLSKKKLSCEFAVPKVFDFFKDTIYTELFGNKNMVKEASSLLLWELGFVSVNSILNN